MGAIPKPPKPLAPPPAPDTTDAMLREIARANTDRQLRASRGRRNAFLTSDSPPEGVPQQLGTKPKLGI